MISQFFLPLSWRMQILPDFRHICLLDMPCNLLFAQTGASRLIFAHSAHCVSNRYSMARIFSIINNKGGTGKTTTALNLAGALAEMNYRVLLLDFDAQSNLSAALGVQNPAYHVGHLIMRQQSMEQVTVKPGKLSLVPSSEKLLDYELLLNSEPGREYIIQESLRKVDSHYDFIIMDCPPSLGILSINSLVAADYYIVPMQTENFAFIGLDSILISAEKVQNRMNHALELAGILLIRYSGRTKFGRAVLKSIEASERLDGRLFDTTIRQDIALMESSAFSQTVFDYSPKSRGAADYMKLANEIITRYGP